MTRTFDGRRQERLDRSLTSASPMTSGPLDRFDLFEVPALRSETTTVISKLAAVDAYGLGSRKPAK